MMIPTFTEYGVYLEGLGRLEREERRERQAKLAAASEERAPLWLRLMARWVVAGIDAITYGRDPAAAMNEVLARSDAPLEDRERALFQLSFVNELERERRKPAPVVGEPYPIERSHP